MPLLLSRLLLEENAEAQVIYACSFAMTAVASCRFAELSRLESHNLACAVQFAEESSGATSPFPFISTDVILTGFYLSQPMCGEVFNLMSEPVVKRFMASADYGQRFAFLDTLRIFEGLWEPFSSPRVQGLREAAAQVVATAGGSSCEVSVCGTKSDRVEEKRECTGIFGFSSVYEGGESVFDAARRSGGIWVCILARENEREGSVCVWQEQK